MEDAFFTFSEPAIFVPRKVVGKPILSTETAPMAKWLALPSAFMLGAATAVLMIRWEKKKRDIFEISRDENDIADLVAVTEQILTEQELAAYVASPKAGAISIFSGVTRDNFEGKEVTHLE